MFHYREKTLDGIIDPDLWKQMETRSLNILVETAYDCLNEEQSQRPNIDEIVTRLEKALELQLERENVVRRYDEPLDLLDRQKTQLSLRSSDNLKRKPQSDAEPELDADRQLIIQEDGTTLKRTPTKADLDAGRTVRRCLD
nr:receptor-like tyrosine-protein kinase kin-15 [Tanacetum cinerariifolium]